MRRNIVGFCVLAGFAAAIVSFLPKNARAATFTYATTANRTMTTGSNWIGGAAPTSSDSWFFTGAYAANFYPYWDAGLTLNGGITVDASTTGLSQTGGGTAGNRDILAMGNISHSGAANLTVSTARTFTFGSGGGVRSLAVNGAGALLLQHSSATAGTGSINTGVSKTGDGTVIFLSNFTSSVASTAGLTINAGTVQLGNGSTVGNFQLTSTGTIGVASGATLAVKRSNTFIQSGTGLSGMYSKVIRGAGGFSQLGSGTTIFDVANLYTGPTLVDAGVLQLGVGSTVGGLSASSSITISSGATFAVNRSNTATQGTDFSSAAIAGAGGFRQAGAGRTVLNAANTYSGATSITDGVLEIASGAINGSSGVTVNGSAASLSYNSDTALTAPLTLTQGTLSGTGRISATGGVTAGQGAILSPGNSPGTMEFTTGLVLSSTGTYLWEINNATGTKGTNWDVINVSAGALDLTGLSNAAKFKLDLTTLTGTVSGTMANYVAGSPYAWRIFDASTLALPGSFGSTPYAAGTDVTSLFDLTFTNWQNTVPAPGDVKVKVASNGTGIDLVVVPEPAAIALALGGVAAMAISLRRRRRAG